MRGRKRTVKSVNDTAGTAGGGNGYRAPVGRTGVGDRMNIREQTPSQRRHAKETKRIDPDSPEIRRTAKRSQGYRIKKKKKKIWRAVLIYTVLFLIVFLLVGGLIASVFYMNLVKVSPSEYSGIRLKTCLAHEEESIKSIKVDDSKYVRDGVMYINMTDTSDKFGFLTTGVKGELKFITDLQNGEYVKFKVGSSLAEVNGEVVRLESPVVSENGSLYVPASFITEYVRGITIKFDSEKSILSILRDTERNEAGIFVEKDVSFKLKVSQVSKSLPEFELSEEAQALCIFVTALPDNPDVMTTGVN